MEMPRLFGSAREVDSCAKIWQSQGAQWMVLKGPAANKRELAQALRSGPSVVHVAAHMLFPRQEADRGMVALSLQSGSPVELLSDTETAGMRAKLGLVVLNGCSSGQAAVLPGAGLMGMSRAWLAAGARAVILTRWPISDRESGGMFLSLYHLYFLHRADGPVSFGVLLRKAQLEELHAGGARADPARWASYFCVETN
jgi:CHAT domain-containing protein